MMDWVPVAGYDTALRVESDVQYDHPLLNLESWSSDVEIIGDIEGEDENYKLLRVVGYWTVQADPQDPDAASGSVYLRCWPGFQNQQDQVVEVPGGLSVEQTFVNSAEAGRAANEKWWWERIVPHGDLLEPDVDRWARAGSLRHPFSYFADFKPGMWVSGSFVPVLTVANCTDISVIVWLRWRLLVVKRG